MTIIATGMNVQMALKAAELLAAEGISARVIDMHTIKPLDEELVLKAAKETGCIVTSEEANVLGGLGAAVAEYLSENDPVPVVRHGVNDEFGRSGKGASGPRGLRHHARGHRGKRPRKPLRLKSKSDIISGKPSASRLF